MVGPITLKRAVKRTAGLAAVAARPFAARQRCAGACILYYHRIADIPFADPRVDDWNVSPARFEQQIAALAGWAEIIPLLELPTRLQPDTPSRRPLVCLTFDDGYASFYTEALPILKKYRVPATVSVITSAVGLTGPLPFDAWARRNACRVAPEVCRPMGWSELEACRASGLVSIGSHSHRHLKGRECSTAQLIEEAEESRAILTARLGEARTYAYPYGMSRIGYVPPAYVEAVRACGYELAVTTDLGMAGVRSDSHLLPRIEAHGVDRPEMIRAKAGGSLGPYYLTDRLRKADRAA